MDIDMWMFIEYIEARDRINAIKKRKLKGNNIEQHLEAEARRIRTIPEYSNRNEQSRKVKEEKEEG